MEFDLVDKFKLEIEEVSKGRYSIVLITPYRKPIAIRTLGPVFWVSWNKSKPFVAELAEKVGCDPTELLPALDKISTKILLEGKKILSPPEPTPKEDGKPEEKPDDITEKELAKARDILEHGDPIKYIGDTIQLMHIGDYEHGQYLWLGTLTPELGYKLHALAVGSTGVGKSDLIRKVCRCVPPNKRIKLDSASSKALYYAVKAGVNIDGVVFNIDDVDPEDPDQIKLLKMMATDDPDELRHWTLTEDRKFVELICARRFVVFASTIESLTDKQGQLLRRYEVLNPREGGEALEKALDHIKSEVRAGKSEEEYPREFNVAQAITREIKGQKLKVIIPFYFKFPSGGFASKTALKKFATLIWAISKARFKQRIIIKDTVLAQPEDFEQAVKLWENRQPLKIDDTAMQVLNNLDDEEPIEHFSSSEGENVKLWEPDPKTSTTLARELKLAPRTVRDKLGHLYDGGWADRKQTGGRGKPWAFWRAPGVTEKIGLMVKKGEDIRQFTASPMTLPSLDLNTLSASVDDYDDKVKVYIGNTKQGLWDEYKDHVKQFLSSVGGNERHNHLGKETTPTEQPEAGKGAKPLKAEENNPKLGVLSQLDKTRRVSPIDKIRRVHAIIDELTNEYIDQLAPIEEIKRIAEEKGITPSFVDELIDQEKIRGQMFEPKDGFVKKVTK